VVATILNKDTEKALQMLSEHYRLDVPRLRVGVTKGRSKGVRAVYVSNRKEIIAARMEYMYDPFTMLHEFYHHLRSSSGVHKGTEKNADKFAQDFIGAYQLVAASLTERTNQ
jgi:hypothetical protein